MKARSGNLAEARVCIVPVSAMSGVSGNIATERERHGLAALVRCHHEDSPPPPDVHPRYPK